MHIKQHLDSDKKHLAGVQVEIVRLVLEAEPEFDSEVLPMAYVRRLDNGEQLLCFPEELSEPLALPAGYVPPAQRDLHAARERVVSALVADQVSAYAGDSDCFKTNGSLSAVFRNGHRGFGTMTATELLDLTQGQMLEGEDAQAAALLQAHGGVVRQDGPFAALPVDLGQCVLGVRQLLEQVHQHFAHVRRPREDALCFGQLQKPVDVQWPHHVDERNSAI